MAYPPSVDLKFSENFRSIYSTLEKYYNQKSEKNLEKIFGIHGAAEEKSKFLSLSIEHEV